jgi:hypothetical protein
VEHFVVAARHVAAPVWLAAAARRGEEAVPQLTLGSAQTEGGSKGLANRLGQGDTPPPRVRPQRLVLVGFELHLGPDLAH